MSIAHLHLLLNHVPVVGIVGVLLLFALAAWRRSSELGKVAFGFTLALAGVAVAVYFTGESAEELVETLPDFNAALVERHEETARVATVAFAALGVLAGGMLAFYRGARALPRHAVTAGLAASVAVSALVAWTANLGGQIRHTEIRGATAAAATNDDVDRERAAEPGER